MIDLHSHILPGIDDGAADINESTEMAKLYVESGFRAVAATPHIRPGMFENQEDRILELTAELREALSIHRIALDIQSGAEYFYDESFLKKLDTPEKLLTYGKGGKYVLVEFNPIGRPLKLREVVFNLRVRGITPIMAHPERYSFVADDLDWVEKLVAAGMLMQGTISPLAGLWGSGARRSLKRLLEAGLIHMIATDAHSPYQLQKHLPVAIRRLNEWIGAEETGRLMEIVPRRILNGEPVL